MRFSSYDIVTRKLNNGGHIILSGLTGLLDLIDEEAYELIDAHKDDECLSDELIDQMGDIKDHFLKRGYLTELSPADELRAAAKKAAEMEAELTGGKWSIVLVPNLGCNYRCSYCFEKESGYPKRTMNKKQVDAVYEIIKDKIPSGECITLYGGEPLDARNRELVEYIVQKGKERGYYFFAVTNGHGLDSYIDLLGKDMIRILQITLDGPSYIHDKRRVSTDGLPSYDKIVSNIERALKETGVEIRLRMNLDHSNAPHMMELLTDLDKKGILNNKAVTLAASPVVGDSDAMLRYDEVREMENEAEAKYPKLKNIIMGMLRGTNEMILPSLFFEEPIALRVTVCGAAHCMKVFAADGSIYSCWSCVGNPAEKIGQFDEAANVVWDGKALERWKNKMLGSKEHCLKCKYAFICGGGCLRPALSGEKDVNAHDCDFYYSRFDDHLAKLTEEYLSAGNE